MDNHNQNQESNNQNSFNRQGEPDQVTVLPPEERDNFNGITIETGNTDKQDQNNRDYYEYEYHDPHKRVYVRRIKLNPLTSFLNVLVWSLLIIAIFFISLPFLLYLIIPLAIIILINKLFRRR